MLKNSPERFGSLQILIHWLVVLLMIGVYVGMEFRGDFPKDIRPFLVRVLHYSFGVTILLLVFVRLAIRCSGPTPTIVPESPHWQAWLAKGTHLMIYAFMIAMPLLALLSYSLKGKPVWFYGFEIGPFTAKDLALAKDLRLMHWHEEIAEWGYWLFGLHAGAALLHHYLMKDNTLLRMLPKR